MGLPIRTSDGTPPANVGAQTHHLFPDLGKANAGGLERKRDITISRLNQNPELRRLARAFHASGKTSSANTMNTS